MASRIEEILQLGTESDLVSLKLRMALIRNKGDLDNIVSDLRTTKDKIQARMEEFNLDLTTYKRLSIPVELSSDVILDGKPYFFNYESIINPEGCRIHYSYGTEVWEIGQTLTNMGARIVIDFNGKFHFGQFELYDPDEEILDHNEFIEISNEKGFSRYMVNWRDQIYYSAEGYLSGTLLDLKTEKDFEEHQLKLSEDKDISKGLGQLRKYLSGGIITQNEFKIWTGIVWSYKFDETQIKFIYNKLTNFYGKEPIKDIDDFTDKVLGDERLLMDGKTMMINDSQQVLLYSRKLRL